MRSCRPHTPNLTTHLALVALLADQRGRERGGAGGPIASFYKLKPFNQWVQRRLEFGSQGVIYHLTKNIWMK